MVYSHIRYKLKVVAVGDAGVGKTTFLKNMVDDTPLVQGTTTTIGMDYFSHSLVVDDQGTTVPLQLWDTAGEQRFRTLVPGYLQGAQIVLIFVDVTKFSTIQSFGYWKDLIDTEVKELHQVALIATHTDLGSRRIMAEKEIRAMAMDVGYLYFESDNLPDCRKRICHIMKTVVLKAMDLRIGCKLESSVIVPIQDQDTSDSSEEIDHLARFCNCFLF